MEENLGRTVSEMTSPAEKEAISFNNRGLTGQSQSKTQCALDYLQSGLSVIPVIPETKRSDLKAWKQYQSAPLNQQAAAELNWPGLALIGGEVSNNLEALDFDFEAAWFGLWENLVEAEAPGLVARLVQQRTQSGGRHIIFRCPDIKIPGNQKLASDRIEVAGSGDHEYRGKNQRAHQEGHQWYIYPCHIETRGEGGYFLAAPTAGYEISSGNFREIPEITAHEREILIKAAKALNKYVKPRTDSKHIVNSDRPGDIYNSRADVRSLLMEHGWTRAGTRDDYEYYTRPGKGHGVSASLIDGKIFYVFTSNAPPFENDTAYSLFSVYAILVHHGDFLAAARDLRSQGYTGGAIAHEKDPEPLPDELLPVTPFDFALMPETLRPWVEDIAERIQCPPDFVAAAVMAALSVLIMRKVAIRPQAKTDWTVIANLWALIVGRPGVLKSPALEAALAPLKRLVAAAMDAYQQAETEYQAEAQAAKLRKEAAEKQARDVLKKNP